MRQRRRQRHNGAALSMPQSRVHPSQGGCAVGRQRAAASRAHNPAHNPLTFPNGTHKGAFCQRGRSLAKILYGSFGST